MKELGFKYFIVQVLSLIITLILIGLKVGSVIDITWFQSILPLLATLLGPFVFIFLLFIWVSFIMIFKKKETKTKFKEDILKIIKGK
jgi:uncharacterized integral membrane protein